MSQSIRASMLFVLSLLDPIHDIHRIAASPRRNVLANGIFEPSRNPVVEVGADDPVWESGRNVVK